MVNFPREKRMEHGFRNVSPGDLTHVHPELKRTKLKGAGLRLWALSPISTNKKKICGHSHPSPENSYVYFSHVSSLLFQAKCGICGQDTMEGFRGTIRVGELLLAEPDPKNFLSFPSLFLVSPYENTPFLSFLS